MSARAGAGISAAPDPLHAARDAAGLVAAALQGAEPDLALVFASGDHLHAPQTTLEGVREVLAPRTLIGCAAAGVLGRGRELESGTAVAVWGVAFDGAGEAAAFHASAGSHALQRQPALSGTSAVDGLPALGDAEGAILLSDPYSFPTDTALTQLAQNAPTVPVLGGLSSARTPAGTGALFFGEQVLDEGAVGVTLHGVGMIPCVSQGAAPLGREVTITAAEGNVIHELAGRPAFETVERIIGELSPRERALIAQGVLIGIVIDRGQPDYEQGDFLVRGVLGADPDSGRLAVGATVRPGQVLRLHARDARSADADLRRALRLRMEALAGATPAGALVFSCNGRGRAMFGASDHDARAVSEELLGAPAAGFFAAGEIGPVGGRSFLHGFTATVAVFPA